MKKMILLCCLLTASLQLAAIPARPGQKTTITMADGMKQVVSLRGDESFHFYVTEDGRPVVQQPDGQYVYSTREAVGEIWTERYAVRNARLLEISNKRLEERLNSKKVMREFGIPGTIVGERKGLVILVNFADKSMKHSQEEFNNQFNEEGYTGNGHNGSVRDYFRDQSYNKLTIDFDVVGPYTVSQKMAYYGGNDAYGHDKHPEKMIEEACRLANSDVNYADYDWDGDGIVEQVYVIYAGYGEAYEGASSNTIWPHKYSLSQENITLKLDGVLIDDYACSNELYGVSGSKLEGIGTPCHEFSHCLGLPDFYDTTYQSFGMGYWSVMSAGSDNNDGRTPLGYTAYERWFSGWIDPIELDEGCTVTDMPTLADEPLSYIIYNQANKNEFYMLYNVQQKGWNEYALGHGMLVLHVDYNQSIWQQNSVNASKSHQRCTVIPADGQLSLTNYDGTYMPTKSDHSGDPYPGTTKNHSLTDTSKPAATLFNKNSDGRKFMGKPIEDIYETNGLISFKFNGGMSLAVPEVLEPSNLSKNSFTANWTAVEDAVSYTVELEEYDPNMVLRLMLSEDFSGFAKKTNLIEEWTDKLDQVLSTPGWTGTKVYSGAEKGAKLGTSKTNGSLTSPLLDAPQNGTVTLLFNGTPYGNDNYNMQVSILDADGNVIDSKQFSEEGTNLIVVPNVTDQFRVRFATVSKRAYLSLVKVVDGEATEDEIAELKAEAKARTPKRLAKQSFEVLTGTSYSFTELTSYYYMFRVKAVGETMESKWSDEYLIDLSGFHNAIHSVTLDQISPDEAVSVYSAGGQLLKRVSRSNWANALPQGTYILRAGDKVVKVIR